MYLSPCLSVVLQLGHLCILVNPVSTQLFWACSKLSLALGGSILCLFLGRTNDAQMQTQQNNMAISKCHAHNKPTSALLQLKGLNAPFPFNGIWIAMEQRPWILLVSWVTNEAPQTYHRGRTVPKGQGAIGANMVWYRLGHVQYVLVCLGQLHVGMSIPSMFFEDKSWWPTPVDTQTCSRTKSTNLAKPLARNLLHYRIYFSTHEASDKKHCLHQTPFSPKCLCNGTLLDWKPFKPNCLCTRKTLSLEPLFR